MIMVLATGFLLTPALVVTALTPTAHAEECSVCEFSDEEAEVIEVSSP
jgi:hypothetical protein